MLITQEHDEAVRYEWGQKCRSDASAEAARKAVTAFAPDDHKGAFGSERSTQVTKRIATTGVDDEIEWLLGGEVVGCVVEDDIRPERTDRVGLCCAGNAGHVEAVSVRDLGCEAAHATGSTEDEDPLAGRGPTDLEYRLGRGRSGDGEGCGLFGGDRVGAVGEFAHLSDGVLGVGTGTDAVHLVADREVADVGPDLDHGAGQVESGDWLFGAAKTEPEPNHQREAGHQMPDPTVDAGGRDLDEDLAGLGAGAVNRGQRKLLRGAVAVLMDRLHRHRLSTRGGSLGLGGGCD